MELISLVKIFLPTAVAFFFGIFFTPIATHFFYKYKMWKRFSRNGSTDSLEFPKIHNETEELRTPRPGGIIIWISVLFTTILFYLLSILLPGHLTEKLNFFSRNQTLIPLATLLFGALLGLAEDLTQIYGQGGIARDAGYWRKWKVLLVSGLALLVGIWFYYKLGVVSFHIPFGGELFIGSMIIPFFILVTLATWSGSVIDGIDGLGAGVLATIFGAYSAIAFANNQIDLAAFSGVTTGATLSFLWYNIPPARFYMGETGMMGLTITLAALAFLTDTVLVLPVVAIALVLTSLSDILQIASRKMTGRRIFRLAPLHHHFEAIGWPRYKVTMRYWVFSVIFAILGIILAIISR